MGTFHSGYPINITWKIHFHIQLATSPTSLRPSPWTPQLEVPRFDHLDLPSSRTSHLPQLQPPSLGNYITEVGSLQNGPSDPPAFWTHLYGAPDTPPWSLHTLSSGLWSSLASRGPQSGQPSYVPHGGSLPLVLLSKNDSSGTCHSPSLTATGPWITSLCPMLFYYNVDEKKNCLLSRPLSMRSLHILPLSAGFSLCSPIGPTCKVLRMRWMLCLHYPHPVSVGWCAWPCDRWASCPGWSCLVP